MIHKKLTNLVTGGAGFLGSHLIDNLMQNNENVICLDNFSTGSELNIQKWNDDPCFKIINHDILQPIRDIKADRIWHLACPASPAKYQADPIKTSEIVFNGTLNMLKLSKELNAAFIFSSSSEVYGEPEVHLQVESYNGNVNTMSERSCYEEGKRIAETLCNDFRRIHKLDIKIMRIFNTYGPKMLLDDGRVISNFIRQALLGKSLTIYGDGNQTRSFCYIDDTRDAMIKFMNSKYNGPFNIGNTDEISIYELAKYIILKVNPDLKIHNLDRISGDPLRRKPSISKAKKDLNWSPKISLKVGLDFTINDFKKRINTLSQ